MFPSEDIQKKLFRHTRLVCKERGEFVPNDLSGKTAVLYLGLFNTLYYF